MPLKKINEELKMKDLKVGPTLKGWEVFSLKTIILIIVVSIKTFWSSKPKEKSYFECDGFPLRNSGFWRIADAGEDKCVSPALVCGKSLACCGCPSSCPFFCSRLISVLLALSASCSSPPFCSSSSLETCVSVREWRNLMKSGVSYLIS